MKQKKRIDPVRILTLGFAALAVIGAGLLMLPAATGPETSLSFWDALFTSTSAVCVTGLTVVNTGAAFTLFGKTVLLCLIQIGGLGFMTLASLLFLAVGKRFSLRESLIIRESLNEDSFKGLAGLVRRIVGITLAVEILGAAALCFRFVPQFGWGRGIFFSLFIAVSAFCNAGFDPLGMANSLQAYQTDPLVNFAVMALVIVGGLGFAVVIDCFSPRKRRRMLHTRVVLWLTGALVIGGAGLIALTEWQNPATLGGLTTPQKLMAALFQSVTGRTAGFDTIGQGGLTPAGKLVTDGLMFIGASPAGTGGGIKTTTFFTVLLGVTAIVRRRRDYTLHKRRLDPQIVRRAFAIFVLGMTLVIVETMALCVMENAAGHPVALDTVLFEVVSAFSTTGLSCGITGGLLTASRFLLTLTMLIGRVGPLTVSMALAAGPKGQNAVRYPEDRLMVG
ncbi:MAG: TrkH family potassium uptake protein [Acutalibacteraceae bacterium]